MLTTIKGIYEHGKIILSEEPPVKTKADVMITFLSSVEKDPQNRKQKIVLGILEGKIKLPENFNESSDDLKDYM